ncbi:hypothetical protein AB0L82_05985 [Nocardia sp. NPDC052001]|uniref:hypothetical protein n=1 Tax=Nocardia sp. NPDC052001 TaxID=3154853 RepID=UPI0034355292
MATTIPVFTRIRWNLVKAAVPNQAPGQRRSRMWSGSSMPGRRSGERIGLSNAVRIGRCPAQTSLAAISAAEFIGPPFRTFTDASVRSSEGMQFRWGVLDFDGLSVNYRTPVIE